MILFFTVHFITIETQHDYDTGIKPSAYNKEKRFRSFLDEKIHCVLPLPQKNRFCTEHIFGNQQCVVTLVLTNEIVLFLCNARKRTINISFLRVDIYLYVCLPSTAHVTEVLNLVKRSRRWKNVSNIIRSTCERWLYVTQTYTDPRAIVTNRPGRRRLGGDVLWKTTRVVRGINTLRRTRSKPSVCSGIQLKLLEFGVFFSQTFRMYRPRFVLSLETCALRVTLVPASISAVLNEWKHAAGAHEIVCSEQYFRPCCR
jgi:hypothetical protein